MIDEINKNIEICLPANIKDVFSSAFANSATITDWTPASSKFATNADIHVVLIDATTWMRESLVQAITEVLVDNKIKVQQLLLLGFCREPDNGDIKDANTAINHQPLMGLLFEAFHVDFCQLPLSIENIKELIDKLLTDNKSRYWKENICRINESLNEVICLGYASDMVSAWRVLDGLSGSSNLRLREEHDLAFDDSDDVSKCGERQERRHKYFEKLMKFQSLLDLYYLAIARRNRDQARTYIVIEDNFSNIKRSLNFIAKATGDIFYVTKNGDECHKLYEVMSQKKACSSHDDNFDWFSEEIEFEEVVHEASSANKLAKPDAILVDLMLKDSKNKLLEGEEVVRHIQEHFPSLPIIVVTKSEEPDVLTRCVKLRGADRVVPKRRLLRLPYTFASYLRGSISPLLEVLDEVQQVEMIKESASLSRRLIGAFRTWSTYPGILWHGEKTVHAAEHTLEHTMGLWKLANELLESGWLHMNRHRSKLADKELYEPADLFRFFMSIWLHDIGSKGSEAYQMADQVRDRHSWISAELLHRNPEIYLLKRGEEADIVELICGYHQSCAPFKIDDPTKDVVKGLFHQSLEEIEIASGWKLMAWTALLRLLDAIEHNWRRVGSDHLYRAKKATIAIDAKYYRERADLSADAKRYADWLGSQDVHMKKHMSVKNVTIRTKMIHTEEKGDELLFWPVYEFANSADAEEYFKIIGVYALTEWYATGDFLESEMGIRLPNMGEINTRVSENTFAVCQLEQVKILEVMINDIKNGKKPKEHTQTLAKIKSQYPQIVNDDEQISINDVILKIEEMLNKTDVPKDAQSKLGVIQREIAWVHWSK